MSRLVVADLSGAPDKLGKSLPEALAAVLDHRTEKA